MLTKMEKFVHLLLFVNFLHIFFQFQVSFQDYLTTVTEEPLLLEAFGQCLPSESAIASFMTTFHD